MQNPVGHFPRQVQIDAYGNGGFRFADMSHRGSILVLSSGVYAWGAQDPQGITAASLGRLFNDPVKPELLLIGTGRQLVPVSTALRRALGERGVRLDVMDTGAAARTYNILFGEKRSVGAALIAVD